MCDVHIGLALINVAVVGKQTHWCAEKRHIAFFIKTHRVYIDRADAAVRLRAPNIEVAAGTFVRRELCFDDTKSRTVRALTPASLNRL
jgi:hypothetical protein